MAEQHTDQQFLESIIKAIVENPNDVRSDRTVDEMGVLITLHINQADMGQVIGRSGRTARAVRTLLRVVGAKNNARVNLKIYEPEGARRPMGGMRVGMMGSGMASPAPRASDENIDAGVDDLNL
ncbi:MAG: hypothetical protein A2249_03480 [Candidatus Jacksonbacteria bacterium RIFOXYA2_FULL_44_7]|nr:MAG: hypothetical protein UW39_C0024G0014 [Parcubacteria group bacterium GW2011_GWC2_44_17]OGY72084.1 MAG: hypothetical protein A3E05_04760 [Candidatus Jacksonbacteria bacterium RIFCSPHIGHO2_12_FULL_44_12]OGY74296.1 MAG: hypothetical protein A3H07_00900 [Candidatus Jacksonbacteria bacterium RIFCSPLOWO2_12_FULL_44_15b]OGY75132.1 MAG: hypothetical protein A2249_03480 [Candidatus Jacksonbacteria bacterium RIFOXYA2_FULL_44_7]HCA67069.1 RNA-binding protein [Candidatus Jacksonbacteria bacterium]